MTTVIVQAHCDDKTEVVCGITTVPVTKDLFETVVLRSGEQHTLYVSGSRIAVVLERPAGMTAALKLQDTP